MHLAALALIMLCSFAGALLPFPSPAAAADHIEIVREVLLEKGQPAMPKQLAPTNDGGFVVSGRLTNQIPWATRVDAEGKVRWRYLGAGRNQWQMGADDAGYETAATLSDDTTVLSGYLYVRNPDKAGPDVVGLLTHIDRAGKVISHQELYPKGDRSFLLNYLRGSVPWGDGVAVIGEARQYVPLRPDTPVPRPSKNFLWLIALNATGNIEWEKLIPAGEDNSLISVAETTGHELVLVAAVTNKRGTAWESGRRVIRLDDKGNIVGERLFPGSLLLVRQLTPGSGITLIPDSLENGALWTVSSDLANAKQVTGSAEWIFTRAACRSSTGLLLLAGNVQGTHKAAIAWLNADLKTTQTHAFQPEDASGWVADILPTGKSNEFVTVRAIAPHRGGGAALTFVKIK